VFLVAVIDVEVLDAHFQQRQLGAIVLEVRPTTMPALNFAIAPQNARRTDLTLDEGQSLAVRIEHAL